ncbi:Glucose/arabinose dehydrogenase, beta-propeller fold [Andreprevotia lacus DSM 23236]|jgi:glucose/arabinose dehydrogenase|uniref:Glucose/arabinose dehydrogenase, beta-propeller fold n=1 Tax=Andreprevotia lacus DSM 23236 TaxID=1121001 RepID=A0A1W1WWX1_9NEIS|nr:PQQ-dependent sugar dehydrogenase [Andreprevotia lacus]SMC16219.1 Glucose/arabinose dehydrogenase, beta-propeller fold [Andreprevotia lacus DSM 23236]
MRSWAWLLLLLMCQACADDAAQLRVPDGFRISAFARVPGARGMALGGQTLFVGSRGDAVYAVPLGRDGKAGEAVQIANGLTLPIGVAFRNGDLYASSVDRILRWPGIEAKPGKPPQPQVFYAGLPAERHHGGRYLGFGPDGWLYFGVGAPCNICAPEPDTYANLQRISPDGRKREVVARGIRNTVGFDWQPGSKALWFTDNGRDWLGDDLPSDELNRSTQPGQHFGYPYCHQGDLADPEFGAQHACSEFVPPAAKLGAHVASLGMRFYTGTQFPAAYRGQIFIAEHGSWNRSSKVGYRVVRARLDAQGRVAEVVPFIEGWLQGQAAWGRPVDIIVAPDGALLVSDDEGGVIWRVGYEGRR